MNKWRICAVAAGALVLLGAPAVEAWWLHHHRHRPVIYGGRPAVVGGGEFFVGGAEFFVPSFSTEFYVPARRSYEMVERRSSRESAEGRVSPGAAGATAPTTPAPTPTASCAHLEKRLDDLISRVGGLEVKLTRIEDYLIQKQTDREKADFMDMVSKTIDDRLERHLQVHTQALLPVLSELAKSEKDRNPDALKAMIEKLRR